MDKNKDGSKRKSGFGEMYATYEKQLRRETR